MSSWIFFGGEDQRKLLMASNQTGRRPERTTTNIVVRNGQLPSQGGTRRRRQGRRGRPTVNVNVNTRPRNYQQQQNRIRTQLRVRSNRQHQRRLAPSQRQIHQKITTTLGTVGSNTSGGVETEMTILLNPATMKEQTGSTSFGPLNVIASQYAMWKANQVKVRVKQLVGNNAASGTVVRVSFTPNANATVLSWSALGARKHADANIGRNTSFSVSDKEMRGPKDGWFYTNTNLDACDTVAGVIQIHSLGKTVNPYQNTNYEGPLFLVEIDTYWSFKDYQQNPGMLRMDKSETSQKASILTDNSTRKILMRVGANTRLASNATTPAASEVIWMITDAIINTGADVFPPPFNWLFRGGWWFVKRLANAPVNDGATYFEVYQSLSDAQNNRPCYASDAADSEPVNIDEVQYQQVTPANMGLQSETLALPQRTVGDSYEVAYLETYHTNGFIPAQPVFYEKITGGNTPVPRSERGIAIHQGANFITTYNYMRATGPTGIPESGIPVYFRYGATIEVQIGLAVAGNTAVVQATQQSTTTPVRITNILFYCTKTEKYNFTNDNDGQYQQTWITAEGFTNQLRVGHGQFLSTLRAEFQAGLWYVAQFMCVGAVHQSFDIGGVTATTPQNGWSATQDITYGIPSSKEAVEAGLVVGYGCKLQFEPLGSEVNSAAVNDEPDGFQLDDGDLELQPGEHYGDPPDSVLKITNARAQQIYESLISLGETHKDAARAANQLYPCEEYEDFMSTYHDMLCDGFSPAQARAYALAV
ncbi:ORF2 [White-tailed deer astrovirus]|nr:ORF2 [White-tailed deer astrovirus]